MTEQQPTPSQSNNSGEISPPSTTSLLKNRNFSAIFLGGLISDIGSFFTFIAMMFLAINITEDLPLEQSAQAIALITLFFILPSLFIGPFTGAFVDRFDRKKIMFIADIFGSITSFALIYITIYTQEMFHIYIVAFLSSVVRLFFYPARGASIPLVVERPEALVKANGIIQIFAQLSRVIGPALAGILIAQFSLEIAFLVDAISYMVSAVLIFTIRTDLKPVSDGKMTIKKIFGDLKTGASLVIHDKVIFFMMLFFMVVIFGFGMIDPLFAVYLNRNFGFGEAQFGLILSVSAVSGLLSAIILTGRGQISRKVTFTASSTFVAAISLTILGLADILPFSPLIWLYVGMAIIGSINVLISIPFSALLQTIVQNEHLGKINGFMGTGIALSQVGGAALASYLATLLPISLIYTIIGISLSVVGIIGLIFIKTLGLEEEAQRRELEVITNAKSGDESSRYLNEEDLEIIETQNPVMS